jgi:Mg2+ and Co2+ transporter CorA
VIILGPIETKAQPPEGYKLALCNFGKRPEGTPTPLIYNGSEYLYPVLHLLNKEYSRFLHNLKLQVLNENNITAHRRRVVATQERLRYCLHNLNVLGDQRNPETNDIERYFEYLIDLTKQLKEDADDWLEKETRMQNKEAAEKNLKTAIEARDEARESTELGKNVWRLTLLAFIFIPLNFMTSAFAMHLQLLGFHVDDGGLPTWPFFAVAVPIELLVLFLFGAMSGYLVKAWRGCGFVVRGTWRKLRRGCGTKVSSGDAMLERHGAAN